MTVRHARGPRPASQRNATYEAHATCHTCAWGLVGDVTELRRLNTAAEKHTRQEGHATTAGMRRVGEVKPP